MNQNQMQEQAIPEHKWQMATDMKCPSCGHDIFAQGMYMQKLSKLAAGTDRDVVRFQQVVYCTKCGTPAEGFEKKKKEDTEPTGDKPSE